MTFRPTLVALGLGLVATAATVTAQSNNQGGATAGDAERGARLAYTCHGCHGIPNYRNAYPGYKVPKLVGQQAPYLEAALRAYATGERSHPTMFSQSASLSDQDRADIAAYLESGGVPQDRPVVGTPPPATQTCVACHGDNGAKAVMGDYPVLAGQHQDYLEHALRDYKSGRRKNPIMAGIVAAIDDKDIPAIAAFFANQPGLCGMEDLRKHGACKK